MKHAQNIRSVLQKVKAAHEKIAQESFGQDVEGCHFPEGITYSDEMADCTEWLNGTFLRRACALPLTQSHFRKHNHTSYQYTSRRTAFAALRIPRW